MDFPKDIPIVLIIFNRPKETREVFARIRDWAPTNLYVIADAPRKGSTQDEARCQSARAVIDNEVDWPCQLIKLYADENMGCGRRIVSGLNSVFENEDCAIILEDDCVPDPSFFPFTAELLERYEQTPQIMQICGSTWDLGSLAQNTDDAYFFSRFPLCWGWATWRRAWKHMQWDAPDWPHDRDNDDFFASFHNKSEKRRMKKHWDALFLEGKNSWAYRWHYAIHKQEGLSIVPVKNLVVNIGCGLDGTHTQAGQISAHSYAHETQTFPLTHPKEIEVNELYDAHYEALNAAFYAPRMNFSEYIKAPLRKLKRRLLSLSTHLNPKIKNACNLRSQRITQAFPDFKQTSTYPSKYSIHHTLDLIQKTSPKHILELGSGSASIYLLSETSALSPSPQTTIITNNTNDVTLAESAISYFSLEKTTTCVCVPLEEAVDSLDGSFWYSKTLVSQSLKGQPPIDFLWVHGPVDSRSRSSLPLYSAIPGLKPYLASHCTIVICPTNASEAVLLSEELRKNMGLYFKNAYAQYGCLIHTP